MHRMLPTIVSLSLAFAPVAAVAATDDDRVADAGMSSLEDLGRDLADRLRGAEVDSVAVAEFVDLGGQVSLLGKLLAEEATTSLFNVGGLRVVERGMIEGVLAEQKFQLSDLVDAETTKRVGMILGVDAVIVGTYADVGDSVRIHARIVSVKRAEVMSATALTVTKTESIRRMLGTGSKNEVRTATPATDPSVIYLEDFSSYGSGEAPPDWMGTEHFGVVTGPRANHFAAFEIGASTFTIPGFRLRGDFAVSILVSRGHAEGSCADPDVWVQLGEVRGGLDSYRCGRFDAFVGESRKRVDVPSGSPFSVRLERRGDIYKVSLNGHEVVVARYSSGPIAASLVLHFNQGTQTLATGGGNWLVGGGRLYSVRVEDL